ncbi:MAG: type 1 glutamine amidotransferase [Cenarchaeum sp. SB0665_bin_23]|nr:type 1 glutamine amidotransferase [Cenarchaeum sp. SB0667_bin_13]MXY60930.1 type 1 glutamine amidotransferase [Cenarchaeum sp. SB0665_bin_23]MXZ94054.1 type 1 glutamine amidotransferase [Cenarchaeum sp. SB0666_bin_15]MYB46903.1 type 1 glutamine amidotransferase [Cenarchaeum sp. SB0662_bin_33]MYC79606.1 type 1 glutamine amidotransferase [Cenarchaeum sp. SB0661_bin_35]MYD59082.1 type 1 glutamine amidotransferase [Cenarchaeum sp. SB0678_bin_8]MYI51887.1 type 1 glutamine amidotransferase [Cena
MFIQNHSAEGPGLLKQMFEDDGLDHRIIKPHDPIPDTIHDILVILGGPQSVNDDYKRLRDQERLIRYCHKKEVPVLGICLGSQLSARALGGRVYRGAQLEMGFYNDVIPDTNSALFHNADLPYWVFHWHHDTFDIPPGGIRLAGSLEYENQAFICGSVLGIQFHLEADYGMISKWMGSPEGINTDNIRHTKKNLTALYKNYKKMFKI